MAINERYKRKEKTVVYQVFTRLFGNRNTVCRENGTLEENGCGKMNDFTLPVLKRIKDMGVTHIWYTGVIRHATVTDYTKYGIPSQNKDVVKGIAGSPYAITDYYDIDPDLAEDVEHRMEEFEQLIERTHKAGMKVVIDFVPNHVARQYKSVCKPQGVLDLGESDDTTMHFSPQNNFYYCWGRPLDLSDVGYASSDYVELPAKATGNDRFDNRPGRNDWYETVKLNYGIDYCDAGGRSEHFSPTPDTWHKMTDILLFWASKGIDGFRCDMAEMVPSAFWEWATKKVKSRFPLIVFIGEVYVPSHYRTYIASGFDYLYDKVGMYDCIRDVICARRPAGDITYQWQATDDIRNNMLYFLENHDEQRVASDFFAGDAVKALPGVIVSVLMQTNPFMLYAGQEFGEKGMCKEGYSGCDGRTTIFDYWAVDTLRRGYFERRKMAMAERSLESAYKTVLRLANEEKAIREGCFFDLMYVNQHIADKQYVFLRKKGDDLIIVAANFSSDVKECDVVVPSHAIDYLEIVPGSHEAVDLLTGNKTEVKIMPDESFSIIIPPYSGKVLKICQRKETEELSFLF